MFNSYTEEFLQQDKIIIANPLWNLSIPTRLKAWIDCITVAGKTFKYTETGSVGIVKGKKSYIFKQTEEYIMVQTRPANM